MMRERVRVVRPQERGKLAGGGERAREEAFAGGGVSVGVVRRAARTFSGWHHHGDHVSYAYVIGGTIRLEFGPEGSQHEEARTGDFVYIPKRTVHREGNPFGSIAEMVVMLVGDGPSLVEVEGPEKQG